MAVLAEIAMVPVGTGSSSISQMIADSVKVFDKYGLKYNVTSTGTNVEGDMDTILHAVRDMDEIPFKEGANRVMLMVRFDDRRDKSISMDYEEKSLGEKL
ncbi:MAG TPA: MTH1187 family thiamine-binding protein [Armatimonadota bacterium]|nr:MTH1187 family thiamine-binding protein [Armatimonadota bacterium]